MDRNGMQACIDWSIWMATLGHITKVVLHDNYKRIRGDAEDGIFDLR